MRFYPGFAAMLFLLLGTGCAVVTSTVPYYTEGNRVEVPAEIRGPWLAESPTKFDLKTIRLQVLPDGTVTVNELKKAKEKDGGETTCLSKFQVQFFRVEGVLYADCLLLDVPGVPSLGIAVGCSMIPGHVLLKVVEKDDSIRLFYPEKLPEVFKAGKLSPELTLSQFEANPGKESGVFVCTAPGSVWEKVLKDPSQQLFSSNPEDGILFKRVQVQ